MPGEVHASLGDIAVATTALHYSIRWRLSDYAASSTPFVTEPPNCALPDHFSQDDIFLMYKSVDECAENLMSQAIDRNRRYELMAPNAHDHFDYMITGQMILRAILHSSLAHRLMRDVDA